MTKGQQHKEIGQIDYIGYILGSSTAVASRENANNFRFVRGNII